jgi:hypothetical protein
MNIITELFEELKTRIELINKKLDEQQKGKSDQEISIQPIDFLDDRVIDIMIKLTPRVNLMDLKEMIKNLETQNYKIQKTVTTNIEEIKTIIDENTHQYHHYIIDIKSSKVFIMILLPVLISLVSLAYNINQYIGNKKLVNNDIKYRYVKMAGGASRANLFVLESVFNEKSSKKTQEKYINQVVNFETKVQQRAEEIEQANLKEVEAQKLINDVKKLREKR